jgi:sugar phosphate permease
MTFICVGGITCLLALLVFWVLGDEGKEKASVSSPASGLGILQSVRLILGSLAFWQIGSVAFFRYGTFVGLQGLWLGPYLMDIKGYSPLQAGNALTLLAIGGIVGGPIAGQLSDKVFRSSKDVAFWGLVLYAASLIPLIGILKVESPFLYGLIFFFLGFFNAVGMMFYTHAKGLFPVAISGTIMAWVNFFSIGGGGVFMPALGRVIDSFPRSGRSYTAAAYHLSFLVCLLGMVASLIFYAFSKKEKRSSELGVQSSESPN